MPHFLHTMLSTTVTTWSVHNAMMFTLLWMLLIVVSYHNRSNIRQHRYCSDWDLMAVTVLLSWWIAGTGKVPTNTTTTTTAFLFEPYFLPNPSSIRWPPYSTIGTTTTTLSSSSPSSIVDDDVTNLQTIINRNNNNNTTKLLQNVVCLVTGASRGIGKGIELQLGAQGATVYVTGTTTTSMMTTTPTNNTTTTTRTEEILQETIEQTAYEIQQLGGIGIPIRCDHSNDTDAYHVLQRIEQEYGYLDILVNNAFRFPTVSNVTEVQLFTDDDAATNTATTTTTTSTMEFLLRRKFWQQGALAWDTIHTVGLRSHYITTCMAMKLLFRARQQRQQSRTSSSSSSSSSMIPRPLIVMISSFGGLTYSFNVAYGVGKAGVDRMVKDMAYELISDDICVVSLWPGVVNTERTQRSVQNGEWDQYVQLSLDMSETPQFTGRAIVALATDPNNIQKSGTVQVVAELATEYGFTDMDGTTVPPSIRSLRFLLYNYVIQTNPILQNRIPYRWIPDIRIPFWMMAQGQPPPSSRSS